MTTYEHVRHADLEWQRQIRAVEVARRALVDATEAERRTWLESCSPQPADVPDCPEPADDR
jgi:hypothetical protein